MIGYIREYTVQTVFVAIQATIIVYGILVTATLLKGSGYPEYDHFFWFSKFVRHAGIAFFLMPAGWVFLTFWYEQSDRLHPTIFTLATGFGLIVLLWWLFAISAAGTQPKVIIHEGIRFEAERTHKAEHDEGGKASPATS